MARYRSQSLRLRKRCLKLFFFVLTFITFVGLEHLLQFAGPAYESIREHAAGIPGWILVLAFIGVVPVLWVIVLGIDQAVKRVCGNQANSYENDSLEEDSDDVETGSTHQLMHRKEPKRKKEKRGPSKTQTGKRPEQRTQQDREDDEESKDNPTDVDVTVHPVDTTIAAGGDARVSPCYNVSLMSFSNDPCNPRNESPGVVPSAPMMQGGPAFFKREF